MDKYVRSRYANTSKYRHILVDEAQDLPGNWLKLLEAILRKRAQSNIWIFEDPLQVVRRNVTRPEMERFEKHSLTKVFRNTHNVFESYKHCHASLREQVPKESFSEEELTQPIIDHNVYGLSPEYISGESDNQLKHALLSRLQHLQQQGVAFSDVAVITCGGDEVRDDVKDYLEDARIKSENAVKATKSKYSKRKRKDPPVIVDSYQRFKGLESRVLVFFIPRGWTPRDVDIYVGFSRSFCHLIVIGTRKMINKIKQQQSDSTE